MGLEGNAKHLRPASYSAQLKQIKTIKVVTHDISGGVLKLFCLKDKIENKQKQISNIISLETI